ncbi:hypothetical protein M8J77_009197 [Diaphorina citri]|nr:hypothetical protein M8J77_009197 [Diaphorina citri]
MTNYWTQIKGKYKYGVAIRNFTNHPPGSHKLSLTVGQKVTLLCKTYDSEWFYGTTVVDSDPNQTSRAGIFPCSFVHTVDKFGSTEMSLTEEMTCVLREWLVLWKSLYLSDRKSFKALEKRMHELIQLRSKILSQTLPVDELKRVKHSVTSTMDVGNKMLGLDLVVRDDQCNLINPDTTSTTRMYKLHQKATQEINRGDSLYNSSKSNESTVTAMCHSIGKRKPFYSWNLT